MCETGSGTCKTTLAAVTLTAAWPALSCAEHHQSAACCSVLQGFRGREAAFPEQAGKSELQTEVKPAVILTNIFLSYCPVFLRDTRPAVSLWNVPAHDAVLGWEVWRPSPSVSPSYRDIPVERWRALLHPFIWWVYLWAYCFPSCSFTLY